MCEEPCLIELFLSLCNFQSTDENSASAAMDAALEVGYRLIDTAFVYGNEGIVGGVLKKWLDSGKLKREDVFITTKVNIIRCQPAGINTSH